MATVTDTLNLARSQIGTVESPPNSNNTKYGIWFNFNRVPWCAIFVSWVLHHSGNRSGYRHAGVAYSLGWARKHGRHTMEFRPGYVCCRINNGSWSGPGHTGIVEAVHPDGSVTSIEGNTSPGSAGSQRDGGGVWRRRRPRGYWNKGCIRIDYADGPPPPSPGPVPGPPPNAERCPDEPGRVGHPTIRRGARGVPVLHLQHFLVISGARIASDGEFGPATEEAVKNHQIWLRDHRREPIGPIDGVVGDKTWQAMHNWLDGRRI